MNISIEDGRVFVDGKETVNPELIGYSILDLAEMEENVVFKKAPSYSVMTFVVENGFLFSKVIVGAFIVVLISLMALAFINEIIN